MTKAPGDLALSISTSILKTTHAWLNRDFAEDEILAIRSLLVNHLLTSWRSSHRNTSLLNSGDHISEANRAWAWLDHPTIWLIPPNPEEQALLSELCRIVAKTRSRAADNEMYGVWYWAINLLLAHSSVSEDLLAKGSRRFLFSKNYHVPANALADFIFQPNIPVGNMEKLLDQLFKSGYRASFFLSLFQERRPKPTCSEVAALFRAIFSAPSQESDLLDALKIFSYPPFFEHLSPPLFAKALASNSKEVRTAAISLVGRISKSQKI